MSARLARDPTYRPIADYGLIGNGRTAALVARDGSIDWCCWPTFDSPAVFCRLLDAAKGGWFRVGPVDLAEVTRCYAGATNVLTTSFRTATGQVRLTDFMPVPNGARSSAHRMLRLVEGLDGRVPLQVEFAPTFDYARVDTSVERCSDGAVAHSRQESLRLHCTVPLQQAAWGLVGRAEISAGDRWWMALTYGADEDLRTSGSELADPEAVLDQTLRYWEEWSARCTYALAYHEAVRRSALVLKLLTFEPTGAVVAAPTTSLPEALGGIRNWDYRYTWLRDSALILYALQSVGYHEEAMHFFDWLEASCLTCRGGPQILYRIDGSADVPERLLDHLAGYRDSSPVRIGNAAVEQIQLDIYGEVVDAVDYCYRHLPRPIAPPIWEVVAGLVNRAAERWREPDAGIWEVRGHQKHFLYSKLYCWVALDRGIRLATTAGLRCDLSRWCRIRDEIRHAIETEGYNHKVGAFTQAFGESALDAAALILPLVGFLPASDPRMRSTVDRIQAELTANGLVYRYLTEDGLSGREATFGLCTLWLADNLALQGRTDQARTLFERVLHYSNDVGLLSEEVEPVSGELLGNFPQGFTHLALIRSALTIMQADAKISELPPKARHGL